MENNFVKCCSPLLGQELMEEYEELREEHYAGQEERNYLQFEKAQSKGLMIDFARRPPAPAPVKPGVTVTTGMYELDDVLEYIDWNPFFQVCYRMSRVRPPFLFHAQMVFVSVALYSARFPFLAFFFNQVCVIRFHNSDLGYVDDDHCCIFEDVGAYTTQPTDIRICTYRGFATYQPCGTICSYQ